MEQLANMGWVSDFKGLLQWGYVFVSIKVESLLPVRAFTKTLSDEDLIWEEVSARLLEEARALPSTRDQQSRSAEVYIAGATRRNMSRKLEASFLNKFNPITIESVRRNHFQSMDPFCKQAKNLSMKTTKVLTMETENLEDQRCYVENPAKMILLTRTE